MPAVLQRPAARGGHRRAHRARLDDGRRTGDDSGADRRAPRARLVPDPRLREIDLGDYEGRSWEEFEADEELTAAFADDPYGTALPGGESLAHLETRVMAAVRDILAAHGVAPGRRA